ncbi:MAG: phosphate transport system substrate-binding protein [Rhodobacteraceae bacterium HLUCCA12]|nr:MAG: phosphate transport system substrate-binding protein [Rhodobacteraceae bacterium HLUCCA12]
MRSIFCVVAMAATLLFPPDPAQGQDVTLSSADGSIALSGDLIAYDGEYLRLRTQFGELTLDARGLNCEGPGCPLLSGGVVEVSVEGAAIIAEHLFPPVLEAFAHAQGLELTQQRDGAVTLFDLSDVEAGGPIMRLRLRASSSDDGLLALVSGDTDLALSLTPLRDPDFLLHVLALDAFVPVVADDGMIDQIAMNDLLTLLQDGRASVPVMANGADAELTLHLRRVDSGENHALGARLHAIGAQSMSDQAMRHASDAGLIQAVARDPFALGLTLRSQAGGLSQAPLIDACGLPVTPEPFALKAGEYPLTQPLYAVQLRQRLPLRLRQLLAFIASPDAGAAIEAAGFVPPFPEMTDASGQGLRMIRSLRLPGLEGPDALPDGLRSVSDLMLETSQLSSAFRFEAGTARIDAISMVGIRQLARDIEAGVHDGHEVILVGFTDSEGDAAANRRLSERRAEAVRDALDEAAPLRDAARVRLSSAGFGYLLPIACNAAEWGRALNRRVEVWLRPLDDG